MAKTIWREPKREMSKDVDSAEAERRRTSAGSGVGDVLNDKAERDDKLEVNLDGTWYAAKLSLLEDGSTKVHYDGYTDEEDDHQWHAKKIMSFKPLCDYVRVISEPLEDEECYLVHEDSIVCALRKAKGEEVEGWHNSFVTAVRKRDHIQGENCTCSFTVIWLDGPDKGQSRTVGCGEICLLSNKDVETHPLIIDLLRHANEYDEDDGSDEDDEWIPETEQQKDVRRVKRPKSKGPTRDGKIGGQVPFLGVNSNSPNAHPLQEDSLRSKSGAGPSGEYYRNQVKQEVPISLNAGALQGQRSEEEHQQEVRQGKRLKSNTNAAQVVETNPLTTDLLRHANQDDVGSEPKEQQEEVLQGTKLKSHFNLARVKVESHDNLRLAHQGDVRSEPKEQQEEVLQVTRLKSDFNLPQVKVEPANQADVGSEPKEQQKEDLRTKRHKAESNSARVKEEHDASLELLRPVSDYFACSNDTGLQDVSTIPWGYNEQILIEDVSIWDFSMTDKGHEQIQTVEQFPSCKSPRAASPFKVASWSNFEFWDSED